MTDDQKKLALGERIRHSQHAIQTGIAYNKDKTGMAPKHLRVGVDSALVECGAIAKLLIANGIFTDLEYLEALAAAMEEEVERAEAKLSKQYGNTIKLR